MCLEHKVIKTHLSHGRYDTRFSGMARIAFPHAFGYRIRASEGCFGGPRPPEISVWDAARETGRERAAPWTAMLVALSLVVQLLPLRRRPRWPRPLSPAQTTRRSPPSSRRSLATPPNSASKSTTTKVRPSTRRPAIVAINVRSAASRRPGCRVCLARSARLTRPIDSEAHAIRAPPSHDIRPAYPAQPNPARAPPLAI